MSELARFGVSVTDELLVSFDRMIGMQGYETRSEALRDLMREALIKSKLENFSGSGDAIGSITLVYDHHAANLQHEMTEIQHQHHSMILSVMHLHVNHDDCLELIAVRGSIADITDLSDKLLSLKGINNGKLFLTLPSSEID